MQRKSVSQRLHEQLGIIIASMPPGTRLLNEPDLAKKLGVSRATLREAMRTFETQGMIWRRQGSGTYVSHPTAVIESGLEVLESIETLAERINLPVKMGDLRVEHRQASNDECHWLSLEGNCDVIQVTRVIMAEGRQVAYLIDILPYEILKPEDLGDKFTGSILDLLLQRGSPALQISRTEINAVTATPEIARALSIQRGDVLLRFIAQLYSTTGQVVDYTLSYFLPGYFKFHVLRRVE